MNDDQLEWFDQSQAPAFTDEDSFERGAALAGLKLRVRSQRFKSGRVTAVLSGVTLDLREARLGPEGATINVQSALSGIDILVPRDWDVVCKVEAVCGGAYDDRPRVSAPTAPRLQITGTVVAGGLCVR
jgi:hypothetical protein